MNRVKKLIPRLRGYRRSVDVPTPPAHLTEINHTTTTLFSECPLEFQLFTLLPAEIRLQIWREAFFSSIIYLDNCSQDQQGHKSFPDHYLIHGYQPPYMNTFIRFFMPRSLLAVCRESRYEAIRCCEGAESKTLAYGEKGIEKLAGEARYRINIGLYWFDLCQVRSLGTETRLRSKSPPNSGVENPPLPKVLRWLVSLPTWPHMELDSRRSPSFYPQQS